MIKTVEAVRYVTPLREGGSLPGIVEADDGQLYAMKFRGSGHGAKALIAELVAGQIGLALGLPIPEIVLIEFDPRIGRSEPDAEIQDILQGSAGINFGLRFLPGAFDYIPQTMSPPDPNLASAVVWFDALTTNVDRTPRNTNILLWHEQLWLIDHGSALYFHHSWPNYLARSESAFPAIKDHVLLPFASRLAETDQALRPILTAETLASIVDEIPESWLGGEPIFVDSTAHRDGYIAYLNGRVAAADRFVQEAQHAHEKLV
jgi:hypothetical protein